MSIVAKKTQEDNPILKKHSFSSTLWLLIVFSSLCKRKILSRTFCKKKTSERLFKIYFVGSGGGELAVERAGGMDEGTARFVIPFRKLLVIRNMIYNYNYHTEVQCMCTLNFGRELLKTRCNEMRVLDTE